MKYTRVEHILYNMFTENTGASVLDSGGAYGRHWQRNQKFTIDDFVNREMITYDEDFEYHSVDTFKFLSEKLDVDDETDELNELFDEFINRDENLDENYLHLMSEFISELLIENYDKIDNTYNFNNTLTQDFQYGIFEYNDKFYVILQLHNGCDIRGGYTKPYIFNIDLYEHFIFNDEDEIRDEHKENEDDCLCYKKE